MIRDKPQRIFECLKLSCVSFTVSDWGLAPIVVNSFHNKLPLLKKPDNSINHSLRIRPNFMRHGSVSFFFIMKLSTAVYILPGRQDVVHRDSSVVLVGSEYSVHANTCRVQLSKQKTIWAKGFAIELYEQEQKSQRHPASLPGNFIRVMLSVSKDTHPPWLTSGQTHIVSFFFWPCSLAYSEESTILKVSLVISLQLHLSKWGGSVRSHCSEAMHPTNGLARTMAANQCQKAWRSRFFWFWQQCKMFHSHEPRSCSTFMTAPKHTSSMSKKET